MVAVCECSLKYLKRFSGSLLHAPLTKANLCIYLDVENPLFVGSQFKIVQFVSFEVAGLGSESIYTQFQHVKMQIFGDSTLCNKIWFQQLFMLLLVATIDTMFVQECFGFTPRIILALCISHPPCGLFISVNAILTVTYTYYGTVFKRHSQIAAGNYSFQGEYCTKLGDLPASFTLIASLNDCSKTFCVGVEGGSPPPPIQSISVIAIESEFAWEPCHLQEKLVHLLCPGMTFEERQECTPCSSTAWSPLGMGNGSPKRLRKRSHKHLPNVSVIN